MPIIEAPTHFYLGRRYDHAQGQILNDLYYYDSRDLNTHMVVIGMTGSGKTGLCISLMEEAGIDQVPAIIIDPKGDITNMLLTFPNLAPEDFLPWVNHEEAARMGMAPQQLASDVAAQWRKGLGEWDIAQGRLADFKNRTKIRIFTPGSDMGLPINILDSLQPPREGWQGHEERHRERIAGIVGSLLALTGKNYGVRDREHVLMSNIIEFAWSRNLPLTLQDLILQVQQPPFNQLGVFDVNTFFPEKARFDLAIDLNKIVADPGFASWLRGDPLDIGRLLYSPQGSPYLNIFYIAHLDQDRRNFIITLILENMLAWMRTLGGTTSLRALLYFDEVFGHFPPYPKNPSTKEPLLRLLKQARAFGIGVILATQNPGDLDYKGLSNAGTWFIGKLQTENDKRKVLDGLSSATSSARPIDVRQLDALLSTIAPRVFVVNNVHDPNTPYLIHSRWAMCYLRGPLTLQQIAMLMAPYKQMAAMGFAPQQPIVGYGQPPTYAPPAPFPPQPVPLAGYPPMPAPAGFGTPPPMTLPEMPPSLPEMPPVAPPAPNYLAGFSAPAPVAPSGFGTPPPVPANPFNVAPTGFGATPPMPPLPAFGGQAPAYGQPPALSFGGSASQAPTYGQPPLPPAPASLLPPGYNMTPPSLPSAIPQFFLPTNIPLRQAIGTANLRGHVEPQELLLYEPFLLAQCEVRYMDRKTQANTIEIYAYHVPDLQRSGFIQWERFRESPLDRHSLNNSPEGNSVAYGELPPGLSDAKRLNALEKEIVDYIYKSIYLSLPANEALKLYGMPGQPYQDFITMVNGVAREQRDAEIDRVTQRYEKEFERIEERYKAEQRELEADQAAVQGLGRENMATIGEAALSLLQGRTTYTISRVARVGRIREQARKDLQESKEVLAALNRQMDELQGRYEYEIAQINEKWRRIAASVGEIRLTPQKKDIHVDYFGVGWRPIYLVLVNGKPELLPAWHGQYVQPQTPPLLPSGQGGYASPPAPPTQWGGPPPAYASPPAPPPQWGGPPPAYPPPPAPPPQWGEAQGGQYGDYPPRSGGSSYY